MTEEYANEVLKEKYGFLSDFLIENKALLMGGPILFALQNKRPVDLDIAIPKKCASKFLSSIKKDMLIIKRSSRYATVYAFNRCLHLHYNKNRDQFFEYRRSLFWNGQKIISRLPISDILSSIEADKIIFTKKYNEVNINLIMLRVRREAEKKGYEVKVL